jgi:hypothetical protein
MVKKFVDSEFVVWRFDHMSSQYVEADLNKKSCSGTKTTTA